MFFHDKREKFSFHIHFNGSSDLTSGSNCITLFASDHEFTTSLTLFPTNQTSSNIRLAFKEAELSILRDA